MNELEKATKTMVSRVDKKMIQDYLFTSDTKLSEKQQMMFLEIALRNNLDPFKREIYAIAFGNEFSIVTGYEVYIQRAEATGQLDGWNCENTEEGAKITIYRKDWNQPFEWEALYDEFDKGQSSWKKMRKFMIKKVCIGQGFRLAFPEELGGMPYFREEVEGQTLNGKLPVQKTQRKSEQSKPAGKEGEAVIKVKSITKKETKKNPRYTIWGADDVGYSTFDKKIADDAKSIEGSDIEALVLFKTDQYGNTIYKDGFTVITPVEYDNANPDEREPGQEG